MSNLSYLALVQPHLILTFQTFSPAMCRLRNTLLLVSLSSLGVVADFLSPSYPYPKDLTSERSHVSAAWKNVSAIIDTYLQDPSLSYEALLV